MLEALGDDVIEREIDFPDVVIPGKTEEETKREIHQALARMEVAREEMKMILKKT